MRNLYGTMRNRRLVSRNTRCDAAQCVHDSAQSVRGFCGDLRLALPEDSWLMVTGYFDWCSSASTEKPVAASLMNFPTPVLGSR